MGSALSVLESDLEVGLLSKRDMSDLLSAAEVTVLLDAKASQVELDTKADELIHFTRTQTHAIFQSVVDSTAPLALKRDVADSYSVSDLTVVARSSWRRRRASLQHRSH